MLVCQSETFSALICSVSSASTEPRLLGLKDLLGFGIPSLRAVLNSTSVMVLEPKAQLPHLDQILIFGHAQVTTQLIQSCLERNIPIAYLSHMGYCAGPSSTGRCRPTSSLYNDQIPVYLRTMRRTLG